MRKESKTAGFERRGVPFRASLGGPYHELVKKGHRGNGVNFHLD